jgi:glucose-1-phosphate thymidylyltransferase
MLHSKMRGVILAGGLGTRLYPLTHITNKHLLPVYNQPMIFYPIQTLVRAGITEIMIVTSGPHVGHFMGLLKNGNQLGITKLQFAYQEKPNGGVADALALAEDFADGGPIAVILGDNTTDADIKPAVDLFHDGAMIFLKKVPDPQRFGVAMFDEQKPDRIVCIEEKPTLPPSNFAVTGLYLYDSQVFKYIECCDPNYAGRGELEITQVNNLYLESGNLKWTEISSFWSDSGTFDSLLKASEYWSEQTRQHQVNSSRK